MATYTCRTPGHLYSLLLLNVGHLALISKQLTRVPSEGQVSCTTTFAQYEHT